MITLPRTFIKEKVFNSPEVQSCYREIPKLKPFLDSYYFCNYKEFFIAFADLLPLLNDDTYLS